MSTKKKTSVVLSEQADEQLNKLTELHGISKSAVVEMLIRAEARKQRVE